jgi:N-methylhydantoinase A/oxoprolinase/acetone carboxylase beta subunit
VLLGIDVGGTHTDAVLIDKQGLANTAKIPTRQDNLLHSVLKALEEVLLGQDGSKIERFTLSTTLCTNAIVQDNLEPVGMLVCAGPGIDPQNYCIGKYYEVVPGALDHRGTELLPVDQEYASQVLRKFSDSGVDLFSLVGKFSPRNPGQEKTMQALLPARQRFSTLGHTLSGRLNFPRRINTAYYNSAVWPLFNNFADAVSQGLQELGLSPSLFILKADGGTMPLAQSRSFPVESILSGPAASVMGLSALCSVETDALLLDMGGTTTDVGVFASGQPIIEEKGIDLNQRPTLTRSLKTRSIAIGGDSSVSLNQGQLEVGPKRLGPCLAQGGPALTLVDALNVFLDLNYADSQASLQGTQDLAQKIGCSAKEAARQIIDKACSKLREQTRELLREINERPVYTVQEVMQGRQILPQKLYLMGGPARAISDFLQKTFALPVILPQHYAVANALGAALAQPTLQAELFADTEKRAMNIPALGINKSISDSYSLSQAREEAQTHLQEHLSKLGLQNRETQILEETSMNMVKNFWTVGRDIRVKCQVRPGLNNEYAQLLRSIC